MIRAAGYVGVTAPDLAQWQSFAEVLGLQRSTLSTDDRLLFRIDERAWRLAVEPGPGGLAYVGWEVQSAADLRRIAERLGEHDCTCAFEPDTAAARGVTELVSCCDPAGNRLELYHGAQMADAPFASPTGATFVTRSPAGADLGFGHAVVLVPDTAEALRFYVDALGLRLTDTVTVAGSDWVFLHANARHHSLSFGAVGGHTGLAHLLLQVADLDMVGRALDALQRWGAPITATLGRHVNDHMTSFYVQAPGGFEIEFGFGARLVNESDWLPSTYTTPSSWGHRRA